MECVLPLKPAVTPFGTQRGKIKSKFRLLAKAYNDSPMFVQEGPHGTSILYIPSVFISYNGEALDEKSVLLRSCEAIEKVALDVLQTITPQEEGTKKGRDSWVMLISIFRKTGWPCLHNFGY